MNYSIQVSVGDSGGDGHGRRVLYDVVANREAKALQALLGQVHAAYPIFAGSFCSDDYDSLSQPLIDEIQATGLNIADYATSYDDLWYLDDPLPFLRLTMDLVRTLDPEFRWELAPSTSASGYVDIDGYGLV